MMKLGLSACLLGEKTRYDGSDKLDPLLVGDARQARPVRARLPGSRMRPGCAEGADALRRAWRPAGAVHCRDGRDLTAQMEKTAGVILERLEEEGLWGFIFKSRSPSRGSSVAVHGAKGPVKGMGIFRRLWEQRFPLLAAEDEDRMRIPDVRSHFIVRLFVLARWRDVIDRGRRHRTCSIFTGGTRFFCLATAGVGSGRWSASLKASVAQGQALRRITVICSWALWQSVQAGQGTQPRCAGHRHN